MKIWKLKRKWKVALYLLGIVITLGSWAWDEVQTEQTRWYNRGLIAYFIGNYELAVEDFDLSFDDYASRANSIETPFAAAASLEQAELSQFYRAMSLIKIKQDNLAALAYLNCLWLTSEEHLSHFALTQAQLDKIGKDRYNCQFNYEVSLRHDPSLEKQGQNDPHDHGDPAGNKNEFRVKLWQ